MSHLFKVGDQVQWSSDSGLMTGIITQRVTSEIAFKGYTRSASEKDPQYIIKNDHSNHESISKGQALRPVRKKRVLVEQI